MSVSVVIPFKNRGALLGVLIDSLRAQSHVDWNAVIVEDQCAAAESSLAEAAVGADPRCKIERLPRGTTGACAARNAGARMSQSDYVIFMDSDDALSKDALDERVRVMDSRPDLDFLVSPCMVFRDSPGDLDLMHNIPKGDLDILRFLVRDIPWQTGSVTWRREALERLGGWDERLLCWQDWEFHIKAILRGLRYARITRGVCFWRGPHPGSIGTLARKDSAYIANAFLACKLGLELLREHRAPAQLHQALLQGVSLLIRDCAVSGHLSIAKSGYLELRDSFACRTPSWGLALLDAQVRRVPILRTVYTKSLGVCRRIRGAELIRQSMRKHTWGEYLAAAGRVPDQFLDP